MVPIGVFEDAGVGVGRTGIAVGVGRIGKAVGVGGIVRIPPSAFLCCM